MRRSHGPEYEPEQARVRCLLLSMNWDATGNTHGLMEAFHLPDAAASSGAIASWPAPFLLVRERADFPDANAAEATFHP
jgi:hypothetical protein